MKKLFLLLLLTIAALVLSPRVSAQTCGEVYAVGTTCPELCPNTDVPGASGYSCCGTIDPDTNECKSSIYTCGGVASYADAIGASCFCDTGFQFMSHGDNCCGYAYSDNNGRAACSATPITVSACGTKTDNEDMVCPADCPGTSKTLSGSISRTYCCGVFEGNECKASFRGTPVPTVGAGQIVDPQFLVDIDPLKQTVNWLEFQTPAGIINVLLSVILFPLAGLILFVMIVWGGFEMLSGANNTKSQEAGKQRITAALIGFLLLFVSYWIAQIVSTIFGTNSLG